MTLLDIGLIGLAFLLAGLLKGVVGLGLPTVALALLSPFIGVHTAMTVILLPAIVTNIWQALAGPHLTALLLRLWPLLVCLCLGTVVAGEILVRASESAVAAVLGVTLIVYASWSLAGIELRTPASRERWLGPLAGLATGTLAGTTGTFVVPSVMYMRSLDWHRDTLVQGMGLVFMTGIVALGTSLGRIGFLDTERAGISFASVVPALVGLWFGQRLRQRLSFRVFQRAMLIALTAIGVHLLIEAL